MGATLSSNPDKIYQWQFDDAFRLMAGQTVTRNRIARLNPGRPPDTAFNLNVTDTNPTHTLISAIAVQVADGKILVGGFFSSIVDRCATTSALHRHTPLVVQITNASSAQDIGGASFIGTSNLVLFNSDADLLGNGNATPNLFVFDLRYRVNKGQQGIYQLTFGNQPTRNAMAVRRGKDIAFESQMDFLGNGSTGRELFATRNANFRKSVLPLIQVTNSAGESFAPTLTGNSLYIAFASDTDLRGDGLTPGTHVYRAPFKNGFVGTPACPSYPCAGNPGLELVSTAAAGKYAMDADGQYVVFESLDDVLGNGSANGFEQLYLKDLNAGTVEALTSGAADSRNPAIERRAASIVFQSASDLLGAGAGHTQIYRWNRQKRPPMLEQITFGTDGDSTAPNLTAKADKILFSSTADLKSTGTSGTNQVFLYDVPSGVLVQLTSGTEGITGAATQLLFSVFTSHSDLVGNGNDKPQLFLANAFTLLDPP